MSRPLTLVETAAAVRALARQHANLIAASQVLDLTIERWHEIDALSMLIDALEDNRITVAP